MTLDLGLLHVGDREEERNERHGRVDEQAPAPREVLSEETASNESNSGADARKSAVHAKGLGAFLGVGERHRDE